MALSKLDNLYRAVILDHSSHPHHQGTLPAATNQLELNNPTCGDVIQLQLQLDGETIQDARFSGHGCSISTASASMMLDAVIGCTEKEALERIHQFLELVQGNPVADEAALGDASMLGGVAKFPARIKCATLAWKALERSIIEREQTTIATAPHCQTEPEEEPQ